MTVAVSRRVLLVDDEPNVLAALERGLRGRFEIEKAETAERALDMLRRAGEFAVIVSDMCMPNVDGATLLSRARELVPDTTRVMLTGNADQSTAARAVNEGSVFRFVNKPCSSQDLAGVLEAGIEHFHRVRAERELLEQTLQGAVELLTDVLELVDPKAFGDSKQLRDQAGWVARKLGCERVWEIELAALMSQLGRVSVPPEVRVKQATGDELTEQERCMLVRVPQVAARLITRIPRLDGVARILEELVETPTLSTRAPNGAMILTALLRMRELRSKGGSRQHAWNELRRERSNDVRVVAAIANWLAATPEELVDAAEPLRLLFSELHVGMVTAAAIETSDGRTLLGADQLVTAITYERLFNHARLNGLREPILIHPASKQLDEASEKHGANP